MTLVRDFDADAFWRDGFCLVEGLLSADECAKLCARLEASEPRVGYRHLIGHPAITEVLALPALAALIRSMLGTNAFAYKATLFDKHRDANWLVAWHQDIAIPVAAKVAHPDWRAWSVKEGVNYVQPPSDLLAEVVALRIHLDPCRETNGPLRVLRGSHMQGRVPQENLAGIQRTCPEQVVVGGIGSALIMRPLLLHASSKASANERRRVLHLEFAAKELPHGLQWHTRVRL